MTGSWGNASYLKPPTGTVPPYTLELVFMMGVGKGGRPQAQPLQLQRGRYSFVEVERYRVPYCVIIVLC
jgi:hypothetical protein